MKTETNNAPCGNNETSQKSPMLASPHGVLIKYCPKCKTLKSIDNFYSNKHQYDRMASHCKICSRQYQKEYRRFHEFSFKPTYKYTYDHNKRFQYRKHYRSKPQNRIKIKAQKIARKITLPDAKCFLCGNKQFLCRHHPNYERPLYFYVLCRKCHAYIHRLLRTKKEMNN